MKKQLLILTSMLLAATGFSQSNPLKMRPSGIGRISEKIAFKFVNEPDGKLNPKLKQVIVPENNNQPQESSSVLPPSAISWQLLCGSMNTYGMLVSQSRPLQYNDNLNAISFIHRKSASYTGVPVSNSGVIVAEVSTNWGTSFDSTCIWSDGTNPGRYPQGAIYNPPGNTNISNAYVVGSGPAVGANWLGNWYASKKLNSFDATASSSPNAQQFLSSSLSSYPANQGPHAFSRYGFSSTDDGIVRSLALIVDDPANIDGMRGVSVVKGSFNAGAFTWTTDSIIPPTRLRTDGSKLILSNPQMAWNESGTVGYVLVLGARSGATLSNQSILPIVYKTTNSGASWSLLPSIDFNDASMATILSKLASTASNTNLTLPYVDDYDMTVDANNKLHIGATLKSCYGSHVDTLDSWGTFSMSINPGEDYTWGHTPGNRPYIYDFIGDGTGAWTYKLIDSLPTEGPSASSGGAGYNDNPWDEDAGSKLSVDSRIQMGRTPNGQYITLSWSESDTNFTAGGRKWNSLPNIKSRCISVANNNLVSNSEISVSKVTAGTGTQEPNVVNRATLHYMSPTTGSAAVTSTTSGFYADINTPITVTNSNPYSQLTNNTTWIQTGKLSYYFQTSGLNENSVNSINNSVIYPNPAESNAVLSIELKDNNIVEASLLNTMGQVIRTVNTKGQMGQNNIHIDLTGISTGIYMVNVKVANSTTTKKIIVK